MLVLIASAVIGIAVGVLSGMLGIGGGMVMVPVFRLGYGMAALQATATSLFAIVPISVAGLVTHVRNKTCYPMLGIAAGLGGACTSLLGVYLASVSPSWAVMLAAAAVITYSSVTMFRKALRAPKAPWGKPADQMPGKALSQSASNAETARFAADGDAIQSDSHSNVDVGEGASSDTKAGGLTAPFTRAQLAAGVAIGAFAGLAGGYVGVGGGFIMIPLFMGLLDITMKKASGTSLMAICILAIPGVMGQLMLGNVVVGAGVAMAAGAIPGAVLGANLMRRVPERQLRFFFALLLVVAAVMLVVNETMVS